MRANLLCLLSLSLLLAPSLAGASSLDDSFDGTAVDTSKWYVEGDSVVEAGGKLTMTLPTSGAAVAAALTAHSTLPGPFQYQVDYELLQWPEDDYAGVGLLAILPSDSWTNWSVQRANLLVGSSFEQAYLADYVPPPGDTDFIYGLTSTADMAGTLRLARDRNSVLTVSVKPAGAGAWVAIYSTSMSADEVRPNLMCWTDGLAPITVAFDNFRANSGSFTDVPADYWAYPAIAAAFDAGVVQGYADNTYRPTLPVDRGSMAVYLARAIAGGDDAVPQPGAGTQSFTDVPADHWAYRHIEYVASSEVNVVQGYPGGNYKPGDPVNRGQMAVYIARAMVTPSGDAGVPDPPAGDPTFSDVAAEGDWSWCYRHVEYLAAEGIVQGYWDGTYRPDEAVTRDQMAVYVARAFALPM
jgi:hypothetical protein